MNSLVPRPIPSLSMLHAEKRDGVGVVSVYAIKVDTYLACIVGIANKST